MIQQLLVLVSLVKYKNSPDRKIFILHQLITPMTQTTTTVTTVVTSGSAYWSRLISSYNQHKYHGTDNHYGAYTERCLCKRSGKYCSNIDPPCLQGYFRRISVNCHCWSRWFSCLLFWHWYTLQECMWYSSKSRILSIQTNWKWLFVIRLAWNVFILTLPFWIFVLKVRSLLIKFLEILL